MSGANATLRPKPDQVLVDIVDYVTRYKISSKEAYETARYCLIDTLGCEQRDHPGRQGTPAGLREAHQQ